MGMGNGERLGAHPDRGLRGAVIGYRGYRRLDAALLAPNVPDEPVVSVVLCFRESADTDSPRAPLTAIALPDDPADTEGVIVPGPLALQIDMPPLGAGRMIGVAADELRTGQHDVAAVLGAEVPRLIDRLGSVSSWHMRFAAVDKFLLARLEKAPPRSLAMGTSWGRFAESPGTVLIGERAAESEGGPEVSDVLERQMGGPATGGLPLAAVPFARPGA